MTRTKKKKLKVPTVNSPPPTENEKEVPIKNLPENFLWMHVKSGTKMRNVIRYALEYFPSHGAVVWSAVGQGIGKAISCAELFKRKHPGLHQMTKLRYVTSDKSKNEEEHSKQSHVPEIHILLSKNPTNTTESGYQGPEDSGVFADTENGDSSEKTKDALSRDRGQGSSSGKITSLAAKEFAAMGLRTGQKRSRRVQNTETPFKKNKKKGS